MAIAPPSHHKPGSRSEELFFQAVQWIRTHQEQFWSITGVAAMSLIMGIFIIHHRQEENEQAWNQLGNVQGQLMQGQTAAAAKSLQDWEPRFHDTRASSYAKFLKADLLYKTTDYTGAAAVYGELAQTASPAELRPLALSAQADAEEMAGHLPQALALTQAFAERYPDHFLAGPAMLHQARLSELTGNAAAASALYDRFLILYPQNPWSTLIHARQQSLAAHPSAAVPSAPLP